MSRASEDRQFVYSRIEQRAIVIEALKIFSNVRQVHLYLGKLIGVSYGTIWNIAEAEGIELIRFNRRRLAKHSAHAQARSRRRARLPR